MKYYINKKKDEDDVNYNNKRRINDVIFIY